MRFAILNRDPDAYPGGDVLSAEDLAAALRNLGHEVTIFKKMWQPSALEPYDFVYIKHVNFGFSRINIEQTITANKPYILQPMFYPTLSLGMSKAEIQAALHNAAIIHLNSDREYDEIDRRVGMPKDAEIVLCPNGTDERFHYHAPAEERHYCLAVAPRKGDKNINRVKDAFSEAEVPFEFYEESLSYEQMPEVYRKARVFVNASGSERCSRTIAEALCSGCRVLATKHNWANDWYRGLATFDPDRDFVGIIRWAYKAEHWDYSPNEAARKWTWERQARMLMDAISS